MAARGDCAAIFIGKRRFSSDANRSFKHLYGGAADARDKFLSALRDFHFEVAGAAHFRALKNGQRVAGRQFSVAHKICAKRTSSGARRGIFIETLPSAARLRSGTIKLNMPVDTNSGSSFRSKSFGEIPRAEASFFLLIFAGLKSASFCVMVTRCGRPSLKRISTGKTPAPVSCKM